MVAVVGKFLPGNAPQEAGQEGPGLAATQKGSAWRFDKSEAACVGSRKNPETNSLGGGPCTAMWEEGR